MSEPKRTKAAPWPKGTSGNPAGRPRGTSKAQAMRDAIAADVPAILAVLVQQALFLARIRAAGGVAFVARDCRDVLRELGTP